MTYPRRLGASVPNSQCIALLEDGTPCQAPPVLHMQRCVLHLGTLPDTPLVRRARHRALLRAIGQPRRYLAAVLAELPDDDLAVAIGGEPRRMWQIRLADWPRAEDWAADVARIAALAGADPALLGALLERGGIERA